MLSHTSTNGIMDTISYFKEQLNQLPQTQPASLARIRKEAMDAFVQQGIPATRHEEWKYTRISSLFNKGFEWPVNQSGTAVGEEQMQALRLPGSEKANELVFVNGRFSKELSVIRSKELTVLSLEEAAAGEFEPLITAHLGHSSDYLKDGIHAMNTAFMQGAVFVHVAKNKSIAEPVYAYHITDARAANSLSLPRSLVYVSQAAELHWVETFHTLGTQESFTNQVVEVVAEKDARLFYYKIQHDAPHTNLVSTTHIRQIGQCYTYAVTISLDGHIVRNNTHVVMESEHGEAHLYGLYFLSGNTHVDNHTIVDNAKPHCYSSELYKGVVGDSATGVFNGKIFVRQDAQKINAYQSNKNILLSDSASVNTKPQLEIFADDVKCSHGCTIGRLDEEGLFYLQSRGIPEKLAQSLLLHGFTSDILEKIKLDVIRDYADQLISQRLELL